jgi:addiction module HigA family antidote
MNMRRIDPITPGEMLNEEFLKPLGITKYRLAKEIGVPAGRISEIVAGRRAITADTDLRLCKYFGLSEGWWLRGQVRFDTEIAKRALYKELAQIKQCSLLAA